MSSVAIGRPGPDEYPPFFADYVARVPEADVLPALHDQVDIVEAAFASVPVSGEGYRYAAEKWNVRQIAGHLTDSERVLGYRALCFARGESQSLPGFDEDEYVRHAPFESIALTDLVREWRHLRESHVLMFRGLTSDAWHRVGTANGSRVTVRAMAYVLVGHVRHHLAIFEERYRASLPR